MTAEEIIESQLGNIEIVIKDARAIFTGFEMTNKGFNLKFEALSEIDKQKIRSIFGQKKLYINGDM